MTLGRILERVKIGPLMADSPEGGLVSNRGTIAKEVIAAGTDLRFGIRYIQSVAMDMKHHVFGHITDGGVRVQGIVIKEVKGTDVRVFGCLGLVGCQQDKGNRNGGVD